MRKRRKAGELLWIEINLRKRHRVLRITEIAAMSTVSQSDGYSQILRICDAMRGEKCVEY